jgi:hypothetical protein
MTVSEFIKSVQKIAVKPATKGMDKEAKQAANKVYYAALYSAVKTLDKSFHKELSAKVASFTQPDGIKPYKDIENFFTRHINAERGKKYLDYKGNEKVASGITSGKLADRFALVFMGIPANTPESNTLMTYISSHLVALGKIGTRPAGIGEICFTLPGMSVVKKSVPASELDLTEEN